MVNSEFVRFERMQIQIEEDLQNGIMPHGPRFVQINPEAIKEARAHLITRLALINLAILVFSGGAGYFLAGRTLRPIKNTLEEQKRFISDSSHELRTPLTSLRSEIEVGLLDKNLTLEKSKKILKSNLEEVIELQNLSDRLLDLAQSGKIISKNSMEEISTEELVNAAIKKTEKLANNNSIKMNKKIENVYVFGIFDRLVESLVILIDNSIKYSPQGSKIDVTAKKTKNEAMISVKDNGIGISREDLPHVFDRFYRAEKARSNDGYGSGISIAKKIVESHNGKIEVKSKINEGSEFIITLPLA
jgi:signal transduction histidine kinase